MKNPPSLIEFFKSKGKEGFINYFEGVQEDIIEFTKLHVKTALEAAVRKVDNERVAPYPTNKEIRNSYHESNIR